MSNPELGHNPEAERSEKRKRWEALEAEIEQITDRLGKGIDPEIKQSVVALKAFEFPTSQSCEGHLEGEHGSSFPWVEIYAPAPEGWREGDEKKKEWKEQNLREQQKMIGLMEEFYKDRDPNFDARLSFDRIGAFGGFRIQSLGANTMELLSSEQIQEKHKNYRKEMQDFTEFLKQKFLRE